MFLPQLLSVPMPQGIVYHNSLIAANLLTCGGEQSGSLLSWFSLSLRQAVSLGLRVCGSFWMVLPLPHTKRVVLFFFHLSQLPWE